MDPYTRAMDLPEINWGNGQRNDPYRSIKLPWRGVPLVPPAVMLGLYFYYFDYDILRARSAV